MDEFNDVNRYDFTNSLYYNYITGTFADTWCMETRYLNCSLGLRTPLKPCELTLAIF